jgi:hypothetical protein
MSFMTLPDPTNLATLKNRGARMMVYHGVSDAKPDVPAGWAPNRTRPLRPYPMVARFKESADSLEVAASFSCAAP